VHLLSKILEIKSGIVLVSTKHSNWYQSVRDRSYCGNRTASQLSLQAPTVPTFPPSLHSDDLLDRLEIISSIFTNVFPQDELLVRQFCSLATLGDEDASRILSYLPAISVSEWHSIVFDIIGGYLSEPSGATPDVLSYFKNKDPQDFDRCVCELESQLSPLLLNYRQPHQELLQQLYITILPLVLLPVTNASPTAVENPLAIPTSYIPSGDCVEQLQSLLHQTPCRLTIQQRAVYFGLTAHRLLRNSDAEAALDFYQSSLERIKHHKAKETELSKSTNLDSIVETCTLNISRCFEILSQLYFGVALQMPIEVEKDSKKGSPRCSCNSSFVTSWLALSICIFQT
jgi:hypothetical protein